HAQAERRPGAADREGNAALVQFADGLDRAWPQLFLGGDQRAVDVADHQLDPVHVPLPPPLMMSIPLSVATITAELRPMNRPLSTTPTVMLISRSVSAGSSSGPVRQSRM